MGHAVYGFASIRTRELQKKVDSGYDLASLYQKPNLPITMSLEGVRDNHCLDVNRSLI